MTLSFTPADWRARFGELSTTLQTWPWFDTARTLRERFRDDHLGLTASSLTFTTLIALVPLVTVMLAIFSAFPMFASFQGALEKYFLQSLVPDGIAKPVLGALTQFAAKATRLGSVGLVVLVFTALALMLTIDRALNAIWRVRRPRSIAQRVLVYWAALTLGPLLLGISLSLTMTVLTASKGVIGTLPGGLGLLLNAIEFLLLAAGMAGLYHYVPNTQVRWRHAIAGGVFVAIGVELAKSGLAWYLGAMPTYSTVYGAFATVPIFLLWIYVGWVIVLWGAVIAAYAPSLSMRIIRLPATPGRRFTLALAVIGELARARQRPQRGLTLAELASAISTDPLQVEPSVEALQGLDWLARLDEEAGQRLVLLVDPLTTPARPLIDQMLLQPSPAARRFRERVGLERLMLGELI
ncbi:MAG: YihY family inner membrane protein [Burkholderiaceae bacterium]|nr:YihY family inner membrane protein [Burkholderiaceae bacterium]